MTFVIENNCHKLPTHLAIYAEDMLKHVRSFSRDKEHFKCSLSLLEDKAHGSLFLFPTKIVEQMLKASPLIAYTNLADIDLSNVVAPSPAVLKAYPFYSSIRQLLKIIAISNDLQNLFVPVRFHSFFCSLFLLRGLTFDTIPKLRTSQFCQQHALSRRRISQTQPKAEQGVRSSTLKSGPTLPVLPSDSARVYFI